MLNFQFYQKVKMLCAKGAVNQLPELLETIGAKKPLIVADPGMVAAGTAGKIEEILKKADIQYALFTENEPNPPIAACEKAYEVYTAEGCDNIIGLGGGSNMDCAKGVQILTCNEGPLIQYADMAKPFSAGEGLILIPTTSGTGSEVSDGSILSDENHIKHNFLTTGGAFADYGILDTDLLVGMPAGLTAATGLDALAHACEAMTGTLSSPYMELVGQQVIRDIIEYLPLAVADGNNLEAREKMACASNAAGFMLVYGHTVGGHSIAQTLGGYFNIPHGPACGYTLPWVMEFNAAGAPRLVKMCGEAMGLTFTADEAPEQIGRKIREFLVDFVENQCRMPKIKDAYEYDESKFEEISEVSSKELFQTWNPRKMSPADCLDIIRKMFA